MKEATGELSTTVIVIVALAAVALIFTVFILPSIKKSIALTTACQSAGSGAYTITGEGHSITCADGNCTYKDDDGSTSTKACN